LHNIALKGCVSHQLKKGEKLTMKKGIAKKIAVLLSAFMAVGAFSACRSTDDEYVCECEVLADGTVVSEVTIGMIAPLTGGAAQFGTAVQRGAGLYIDRFNAQNGLQIRVISHDDEHTSPGAITGFNRMLDNNVTAILGAVTSGPTMAISPRSFEENMPMITATATHANVTVSDETGEVFTSVFRACFIDPFQGQTMAEFAYEVLGAQTFAVLYMQDVAYSIGLAYAFIERAEELGLTEVARAVFADGDIDMSGQLTNISRQNPDVLFVPAYYRNIMLIGPQSAVVGMGDTTIIGADGWATITDAMGDASSIEGAYFLTGFHAETDSDIVRDFVAAYNTRHGNNPNMFATQAYDAAHILISAIQATLAEVNYAPHTNCFRLALIANMAATNVVGVTGPITFDEFNNPNKLGIITRITEGREAYWGLFPATLG